MTRYMKILVAAVILTFGASSCLEKYPGSAIPEEDAMKTYDDAVQHLTGVYTALLSSYLYSGQLTLLPDLQADLAYAVEGNTGLYSNIWRWDIRPTDKDIEGVYGSLYSVIGNCNFFLERIGNVVASETDDSRLDDLDNYTGEVRAVRAMCYLELLKCFCKAYDPATAKEELGVVLRTKYSEPEPVKRSSLYDCYDFVIRELETAEKLMDPDLTDNNSSYVMSTAAIQALHARASLYMQDWDNAIKYAGILIDEKKDKFQLSSTKTAIQTSNGAISSFGYMWAYDLGTEIIWQLGFTATSYGGALGTIFFNYNRDYTYFYPDYVVSQSVIDLYSSADGRYASYFVDPADIGVNIGYSNGLSWPLLAKYWGNESLISSNRLYGVTMPKPLRLAEQYLIRAEAYCRKGDYSKASGDISTLRAARYTNGGSVSLTQDNWLDEISNERVRELYMEGFRLHDLKRWHRGFERTPQSCSQAEGSSLKINADDYRFVWPIPQNDIEAPGSGIEQNESY